MDLIDIIASAQGGRGLDNLGQQFGLSPTQTRTAVEALAPIVAAGISRNASSGGGLADLLGAVLGGNHGRYLDDPNATQYDAAVDDGNAILGHVFGSKDVSRGVAMKAGELSGIGGALLKKMLPVIATMVMGALAKRMFGGGNAQAQAPGGGGLGDILGDILSGGQRGGASGGSGGGLGDILGDILGGGQRQPQAQPAPQRVPQGGGQAPGSLEDMLKDILGGNGKVVVHPPGQGVPPGMEDILRDIFGGGAGGGSGRIPPQAREEAARRGHEAIDDMLGRRSTTRRTGGSAADDLLNSVEESLRRR